MKVTVQLFTAKWCGPCKIYKPLVRKLMEDSNVKFEEFDADEDDEAFRKLNVKNVPTLIIFNDGVMVASVIGAVRKSELMDKLGEWHVFEEG
ncbi:MAG: thioredoxin [Epsilonproteobacteria bacterium]|nr:MAG: thioredoxin [Campylobacterota bacterium]